MRTTSQPPRPSLLGSHTGSVMDWERVLKLRGGVMQARNNLTHAERSYAALAGTQNLAANPAKQAATSAALT